MVHRASTPHGGAPGEDGGEDAFSVHDFRIVISSSYAPPAERLLSFQRFSLFHAESLFQKVLGWEALAQ
jgi:hypothetical protein